MQKITFRKLAGEKYIYPELQGHFIEFLGSCIYDGIWVERIRDSELSWNPQRSCGCVSKAASAGDPLAGRMLCGCISLAERHRSAGAAAGYIQ
ncbi:MAG: hypothetical protein ACLRIL_03400, partial [Fusicatenibacter saccharivorans]